MLKKEVIAKLAALAKIKVEDLQAAITAEAETDLAIDETVASYSPDELTQLKNNEYKSGKEKGVEMAIKEAKEKHGFEFQGKTIDGLVEAASKKALAEAKLEPNQKVQELTEKITNLQKTVGEYEGKLTEKDKEVMSVKINGELYKHIPKPGENGPALGADDVIQLMRANGYEFKLEEGKTVTYKDGKVVQDKVSNPLSAGDVVQSFMKEKKLITEDQQIGGRGGNGGNAPAGYSKLSDLTNKYKAEGKSLLGEDFSKEVAEAQKANPNFDLNG